MYRHIFACQPISYIVSLTLKTVYEKLKRKFQKHLKRKIQKRKIRKRKIRKRNFKGVKQGSDRNIGKELRREGRLYNDCNKNKYVIK